MTIESSSQPVDPLVTLRDLLIKHFNESELRDLCFELKIEYEVLSGGNKNDKARELVTYCQRHGLLSELAQRIEILRAGVNLATPFVPVERFDRAQWLRRHKFKIDPFSSEAFRAETDPLFDLPSLPAFVDLTNDLSAFEQLVGTPQAPGYRFIFAPMGGGKTSLRRHIFTEFEQNLLQWYPVKGELLIMPVEYILHDYDPGIANARFHIEQITKLLTDRSRTFFNQDIDFHATDSPLTTLENIVNSLRNNGLDGLCVLIDNLDSGPHQSPQRIWRMIESIATRTELLTIEGLMFKFLLPVEVLNLARTSLPIEYVYQIQWQTDQLTEILGRRLMYCMDQESRVTGAMDNVMATAFPEMFAPKLADRIADDFIDFGYRLGSPADMWRLGYYLLDEHFQQSPDRRRAAAELITFDVFYTALARLSKAETEQRPLIIPAESTESSPTSQFSLTGEQDSESSGMIHALERIVKILEKWDQATYPPDFASNTKIKKISNLVEEQQTFPQEANLIQAIDKLTLTVESLSNIVEIVMFQNSSADDAKAGTKAQSFSPEHWQAKIGEVRNYIGEDDLKRACESIKDHLNYDQGILFLRELNGIENESVKGTLSREAYQAERNKLADRLLQWFEKHKTH